MIAEGVAIALGTDQPAPGVEVTVSIPGGEELAKKTLNARIGILGGLSVLGTTGVVRPMSTASWRASVVQAIDVAAANSILHIVLTTGGRSERFARGVYPGLPEMAFVQMGIFTGDALKRARARGVTRVTVCGMIGKLAKLAAGRMQTHVAGGGVDLNFLARLAEESGANRPLIDAVASANTARHVEEVVESSGFTALFELVAGRAACACSGNVDGGLEVEVILFDFMGRTLARAVEPVRPEQVTA
jgi:cobalt-precorrin-5B (C1)-methyltransferase